MTATAVVATRHISRPITQRTLLTIALFISLLEGYDLVCFGVTVPSLLADPAIGFTPAVAGVIGAVTPLGMLIGAGVSGTTMTRVGPRRLIFISMIVFTAGMVLSAVAPSAVYFAIARVLVGLGLGVVLPTLLGYVADLTHPTKRNRNVGIVMAGYALGGLLAPLLGALLLPDASFRWIYALGAIPALIIFPFAVRYFPESPVHLLRSGRSKQAAELTEAMGLPMPAVATGETRSLSVIFLPGVRIATILFWLTSACGLLLVFGLSTWLPTIMQSAGYSLGSALLLTAVVWTGAGVGMVLGGRVADKVGAKPVVVIAFLAGAVSLVLISFQPNVVILLALMFVSGFGFIGSQSLVNSFILGRYPDAIRGPGLSWALTAGRPGAMLGPILGAWVITAGLSVEWNFYVFAAVGLLGALFAALVPRISAESELASPLA